MVAGLAPNGAVPAPLQSAWGRVDEYERGEVWESKRKRGRGIERERERERDSERERYRERERERER